jgi:hypothetical protein
MFIRTCQDCGHQQEDKDPVDYEKISDSYRNRKCKKCKSASLDIGSEQIEDSDENWED